MRTHSQKPETTQQTESAEPTTPGQARVRQSHEASLIFQLQRTIGNRAVRRMLQTRADERDAGLTGAAPSRFAHEPGQHPAPPQHAGAVQAKLAVNRPGDEYEEEADRVSEQVMRMPEPQAQGARPDGGGGPERQAEQPGREHKRVQTKRVQPGGAGQVAAPPGVQDVLAEPGQPLDPTTRGFMEPRFGRDFGRVRVHADPGAAGSAESIDARAYTVGDHVVFGPGEYQPGAADGKRLLAHELAHVAQQDGSTSPGGGVVQREDKPRTPATKPATETKKPVEPAEQKEDPKVPALKAELVATFGLSAVTDSSGAKWTAPELEKMKRGLARIPAAERNAIKGVELRRVVTTTEFGAVAAGLFKQEIAAGTGVRQDRIEIANDAFDSDKDYDEGGAHTLFGDQRVEGAPSESVLGHEVGHAVEAFAHRQAEEARVKADISDASAFKTLEQAVDAYNAATTSLNVPGWNNVKEKNYQSAIIKAHEKLEGITTVLNKIPGTPTAAESKKGAADIKAALEPAKKAIAARNAARNALPQGSTYAMPSDEAAQDAWLAAAAALVPPYEARAKTQDAAEKAQGAEDATNITIEVSSGRKVQMTRRLAEFVAVVEANNIDIANSGIGNHAVSHWPDNPEEAYAELYSFSLTAPEGLKKFDKKSAVATYFTSPVGLKGALTAQAAAWIAKHK